MTEYSAYLHGFVEIEFIYFWNLLFKNYKTIMQFLGIEKQDEHSKKCKKCVLLASGPPDIVCPKCMSCPSHYDNNLEGRLLS